MKIEIEGYGEFEVQDNFANLPEDKQQEIANELIKAKQLSKNINIPVSTTQGIIDSALQGLSFGFSDEIAGFFDEDAKENIRKRLRSFRSSNPALAIGSEIAGSLPTSILGGFGLAKAGIGAVKGAMGMGGAYGAGASAEGDGTFGGTVGALTGGAFQRASPYITEGAKKLVDKGVNLTVGDAVGGGLRTIENAMTSVPLVGNAVKGAYQGSRDDFNRVIYEEVLEPLSKVGFKKENLSKADQSILNGTDGRLTQDFVGKIISNEFDKIVPNLKVPNKSVFEKPINDIIEANAKKLTPEGAKSLKNDVDAFFYSLSDDIGDLSGNNYKQAISDLAKESFRFKTSSDPMVKRKSDVMDEIVRSMKTIITEKNPTLATKLKSVDESFSRFIPIRETFKRITNNEVTPNDLITSIRQADKAKTKFRSGKANLQETASLGKEVLGQKLGDSGTATRNVISNLALSGGGGAIGGGALGIDPLLAGTVAGLTSSAYTPLGTNIMRRAITGYNPEVPKGLGNIGLAQVMGKGAPYYGGLLGSNSSDINFFGMNRR